MARQVKRISDLPAAAPLEGDELLEMVQGGENVRVRADELGGGDIAIDDVQGLPEALDERVLDDDPRLSDSRVPMGGAGGVLSGQYPNPGFAVPMATADQLDGKVDKVEGKGLSTHDFTDPLYDKLVGLEGTHWRGTFVSIAALEAGVTDPVAGDYADVDSAGADVERYIWDATDSEWVVQSGAAVPITASQVKQLYESNPDTNAFTDADEAKLDSVKEWAHAATAGAARDDLELGTAAIADVATPAEAIAGTAGVLPDAEGVQAHFAVAFTEASKEELIKSTEATSGGRVTVRYTAKGEPCYFYVLPKYNLEDLPGWDSADGTGPHPAFIQNGVEKGYILVGMYQAAEVAGEAVSQPYMAPKVTINYDNSLALCRASGAGFDMMSNWDWSAVAMWCMANGFQPRGNSAYGRSHEKLWETGRLVDPSLPLSEPDATGKSTLTGSGPNGWRHDNSPHGIADLAGNVWEWQTGFKLVDGVAHIAPDGGVYTEEQYIDTEFSPAIVSPWLNTSSDGAPAILKQALIVPSSTQSPGGTGSLNVEGERIPLRGGLRNSGFGVGLGALNLTYERAGGSSARGFRLVFRE